MGKADKATRVVNRKAFATIQTSPSQSKLPGPKLTSAWTAKEWTVFSPGYPHAPHAGGPADCR